MPEKTEADPLEGLPSGTVLRVNVLIVAAVLLVLTIAWLLSGGGAEFFHRKFHLHTFLADSGALQADADVLLNGVRVGKVTKVGLSSSLDPNRAIRADVEVEWRYMNSVSVDSVAALTADNLIGDKYIAITAGRASDHVGDGAEIASLIQNGGFNPADLVVSLQVTLQRVDAILNEIISGDTPTSQFVRGDEFYNSLNAQLTTLQQTVKQYSSPKSPTGKLLFTPAFYNETEAQIRKLDGTLASLQEGKTPAGKLLSDSSSYDRAVQQIQSFRGALEKAQSGGGAGGSWLKDDSKYQQIRKQLDTLNAEVDQLTSGDGSVAKMLASRQLYDSLTGQSVAAGKFLKQFREDPQHYLRIKPFGKKKSPTPKSQTPQALPRQP